MFAFELYLARYITEMHKEREAKAAEKAQRAEQEARLNQSKIAEGYLRNTTDTKTQASNSSKRGAR